MVAQKQEQKTYQEKKQGVFYSYNYCTG